MSKFSYVHVQAVECLKGGPIEMRADGKMYNLTHEPGEMVEVTVLPLSASEALFGFAAWLTTREDAVTFTANHDAAIAAELVSEFCSLHALADPRDGWDLLLKW